VALGPGLRRCLRRWLTTPEARIAGRMGLFRMIYAAFYIWHLSWLDGAALGLLPEAVWQPVDLLRVVPLHPPSAVPGVIESCLVAALVLLLAGLCVGPVTLVVLVLGVLLEAFHQSFGKVEHASVFLVFYIPLFMVGSQWGGTWSLDALLAQRAGRATTSPTDDSWRHALPMRAALLVLVLLFFSAALAKVALGTWLTAPDLVTELLLGKNVEAAREGLPANAILPFVATHPLLSESLRHGVLLFEVLVVLVLLDGRLRAVYLAAALVFHALNALLLVVTFTPILIVYALFVDWQWMIEQLTPGTRSINRLLRRAPSWLLTVGVLTLAALAAWSWNLTPTLRGAIQLGGRLDWRTIWYPVLPLALAWLLRASLALLRAGIRGAGDQTGGAHGQSG
jgi:hypothetical protein